jgi:hypothetical protein
MDDQQVINRAEPASAGAQQPASGRDAAPQGIIASLDRQPDETLRDLIARAKALLASRTNERQDRALAEIRRLAREHGLDVQAKKPGRKRGRPRKSGGDA